MSNRRVRQQERTATNTPSGIRWFKLYEALTAFGQAYAYPCHWSESQRKWVASTTDAERRYVYSTITGVTGSAGDFKPCWYNAQARRWEVIVVPAAAATEAYYATGIYTGDATAGSTLALTKAVPGTIISKNMSLLGSFPGASWGLKTSVAGLFQFGWQCNVAQFSGTTSGVFLKIEPYKIATDDTTETVIDSFRTDWRRPMELDGVGNPTNQSDQGWVCCTGLVVLTANQSIRLKNSGSNDIGTIGDFSIWALRVGAG